MVRAIFSRQHRDMLKTSEEVALAIHTQVDRASNRELIRHDTHSTSYMPRGLNELAHMPTLGAELVAWISGRGM